MKQNNTPSIKGKNNNRKVQKYQVEKWQTVWLAANKDNHSSYAETIRAGIRLHPEASLSELRRHSRPAKGETPLRQKPKKSLGERLSEGIQLNSKDKRLREGMFQVLQQLRHNPNISFSDACRNAEISREAAKKSGLFWKAGRRWRASGEDSWVRGMSLYTNGTLKHIHVRGSRLASEIGRYMAFVGQALNADNPGTRKHYISILNKYRGHGVKDINGNYYPYEHSLPVLQKLNEAIEDPEIEIEQSGGA